jgi:hypothetical protein
MVENQDLDGIWAPFDRGSLKDRKKRYARIRSDAKARRKTPLEFRK